VIGNSSIEDIHEQIESTEDEEFDEEILYAIDQRLAGIKNERKIPL